MTNIPRSRQLYIKKNVSIAFLYQVMRFLLLVLWAAVSLALSIKPPLAPTQDLFYDVPANVSGYNNGDIIKWRTPPAQLRSIYFPMNVKNAWQLLVKTEDSFGNPTAFVTTVMEPYNAIPSKVLSYQAFEDSACLDCSPSYSVLYGASMNTIGIQYEVALMEIGLSKNWYVVLPDYEGPKSAFGVGPQSGKATLDSIRAALASHDFTGIDGDAKVGLFGYSGGSIACGWASQLQPSYAPELKKLIAGAAFGGFVTNITLTAISIDGTSFSGIAVAAMNGIIQEFSSLKSIFVNQINLDKLSLFYEAKTLCLKQLGGVYHYVELFTGANPWMYQGTRFFGIPQVAAVIMNTTLAVAQSDGVPEVPLFIFQGQQDEVVPLEQPQRAYDNWCSWGAPSIEFALSSSSGHVLEGATGFGAAFAWLEKIFDGHVPVEGCTRTIRKSNLLYPGADANYRQFLDTLVKGIFGAKIGQDTDNLSESTMLSKVLAYVLSEWFSLMNPLPQPQVAFALSNSTARNETESRVFKGLGDVVRLWKSTGVNPWSVLQRNEMISLR